jgi:hypothetical protein
VSIDQAARLLATQTETSVADLYVQLREGRLSERQFESAAAVQISRATVSGTRLGDVSLAALISREVGEVVTPLGLPADRADQARIRDAVATVLQARPDVVDDEDDLFESQRGRLGRLARAEPLEAFQGAMVAGMVAHKVPGWVRQTDADPCPACQQWADGKVRPTSVQMISHTNCACYPRPVF